MPLEALLLSRDENVIRVFRRVFGEYNIELKVLANSGEGLVNIAHHKYDSVVVDCDDVPDGRDVLEALRTGRSNRSAIAFAILNGTTTVKQANALGANFVLDKPLIMDRVSRSVRAAHGLIQRERRRYHRHELNIQMTVVSGPREVGAKLLNLSEGGCAIQPMGDAVFSGMVSFHFMLPESKQMVDGKAEVAWTKPDGSVGLHFTMIEPKSKSAFDLWLTEHIEHELKKPSRQGVGASTLRTESA